MFWLYVFLVRGLFNVGGLVFMYYLVVRVFDFIEGYSLCGVLEYRVL